MSLSNYNVACSRNIAGNLHLLLCDAIRINDITIVAGEVTAIQMQTGYKFHRIGADQDSIHRETILTQKGNFKRFDHHLQFRCGKLQTAVKSLTGTIRASSPGGIASIVIDLNLKGWLTGYSNQTGAVGRAMHMATYGADSNENVAIYRLQTATNYKDLPLSSDLVGYILGLFAVGTYSVNFATFTADTTQITADSTLITADQITL